MHFRTWVLFKTAPLKNAFQNIGTHCNCSLKNCISEIQYILKLLPQKMNFRTWVLKYSNNWLLIIKLAYKYYRKTMLSAVEVLLIYVCSENMWSLFVHLNHYKKRFTFFSFSIRNFNPKLINKIKKSKNAFFFNTLKERYNYRRT